MFRSEPRGKRTVVLCVCVCVLILLQVFYIRLMVG